MDNDKYVSFSVTLGGILKESTKTRVVSLIIHNNTDKLATASRIYVFILMASL